MSRANTSPPPGGCRDSCPDIQAVQSGKVGSGLSPYGLGSSRTAARVRGFPHPSGAVTFYSPPSLPAVESSVRWARLDESLNRRDFSFLEGRER
jgi:hypothetical protein